MKYLSVCSGIEAATSAWHHLGWEPVAFSEIEPFPSAVLKHHYPNVPNWGDMTKYQTWPDATVDLLVGGTPCQSFSIAGLRKGLEDPRGNLMLTFLGIADRYRPKWIVWENVPGVLSSNGGKDFGTFLAALGELGYGWAYRVLDAQWFGVAQRRRRVFVVGCLGDQRSAAAVLFESESVSRHPAPSREKGQGLATNAQRGIADNREQINMVMSTGQANAEILRDKSPTLNCNSENPILIGRGSESSSPVTSMKMESVPNADAKTESANAQDHTANQRMAHHTSSENSMESCMQGAVLMRQREGKDVSTTSALTCAQSDTKVMSANQTHSLYASEGSHGVGNRNEVSLPLKSSTQTAVQTAMQVRRLTPVECERLQGFPDNHTNIPWRGKAEAPDGPRYKALGNSMAVPVMRWLGERINA